jgi:AcrR family transcriptional regulator
VTATRQARTVGTRLPKPARRRQLLGAAREVFVAQGYHAAAMDEIAERAGVSKPVLYQHFPGKLELYLALLDESVDALTATVRSALASTTDNKQRVTATFTAFFDFVGSTGQAFRLVFESDLRNEPAVRDRLDRSMRDCAEMISEIIREDAGVSDDQARLLGMGLVGMAQVSATFWLSTDQIIPKGAAEQLIARLAWRGISGWPLAGEHGGPEHTSPEHSSPEHSTPERGGPEHGSPER